MAPKMTWLIPLLMTWLVQMVASTQNPLVQLKIYLERNDWTGIEDLIKSGSSLDDETQTKFMEELTIASHKVQSSTRRVESIALTRSKGANIANPALQWAQNNSVVFIEAKYATRWGAPACTSAQVRNVEITSKTLKLSSSTETGGQVFELDLTLFGDIDSEKSSWSASSVGRVSFTLKKQKDFHWERLTSGTPPWNCKFWFELQESLGYGAGWMHSSDAGANIETLAKATTGAMMDGQILDTTAQKSTIVSAPSSEAISSSSLSSLEKITNEQDKKVGKSIQSDITRSIIDSDHKTYEKRLSLINEQESKELEQLSNKKKIKEAEVRLEKTKKNQELRTSKSNNFSKFNQSSKRIKERIKHSKILSLVSSSPVLTQLCSWQPLSAVLCQLLKEDVFWKVLSYVESLM